MGRLENRLFRSDSPDSVIRVEFGDRCVPMPCCHGAGGLAGQYRFGGRSDASVAFLGLGKCWSGFGSSFVRILSQFPIGILGVLLLFAGIELAMASRDMNSKEESFCHAGLCCCLIGSKCCTGIWVRYCAVFAAEIEAIRLL
ncbi:CCR4-NOT core ubiquitin-protein ligase subunit mot2 [Datura stramonium]|uniref:CCR4-NOT core ubiquitin-protein ligase subunit mot2 n=1 Tax=Datura stramonium TaxID=4076 RepID=A0ABS8RVG2_DATST|nr:CCR4-NOT core ubiquitin-protein ligase subunit mot2 [Datura stramonium]